MYLKSLNLYRNEYGPEAGRVTGTVSFVGELGEIKLNLSNEQVDRFLPIFAEALVESAKEVALKLNANLLNEVKLLK
jgi:hypothetical protein